MSAGLRETYDQLVKTGMLRDGIMPDGFHVEVPDMDEVNDLLLIRLNLCLASQPLQTSRIPSCALL